MKKKIHVAIGSKNPCKIDSVKSAFHKVFEKHLLVQGPVVAKAEAEGSNDEQHKTQIQTQQAPEGYEYDYELVFTSYNVPSNVNDQPIGDDETVTGAKNRALAAFEAAQKVYTETTQTMEDALKKDGTVHDDKNDKNDENDCYVGPPDFSIGLEGGIEIRKVQSNSITLDGNGKIITSNSSKNPSGGEKQELWCMAWMAIIGTNSTVCTLAKHESSTFQFGGTNTSDISSSNNNSTSSSELKWGLSKTAAFQLPQKISDLILNDNVELGDADDRVFNRVNSKQGSGTVGVLTNDLITRSDYYDHAIILALTSFIWPEHYL